MRKPLIAGNWKMNHTPRTGAAMIKELAPLVALAAAEVVICPPAVGLQAAAEAAAGSVIAVGAQNMHWESEGAYTGEISAAMLKALQVKYVIVGHSERRAYFGETDEIVNKKARTAVEADLIPIVCVGETERERAEGRALQVIERQLAAGLDFWDGGGQIVVAYEPVWAIGTGLTATAADAEEVIAFIRDRLALKSKAAAEQVQILYGGSVKPNNIGELMQKPNIDGALVGGASLRAADFSRIVNY